jgi:non-homologous end joining protein Ku
VPETPVVDLMEALRRSVAEAQEKQPDAEKRSRAPRARAKAKSA